MASRPKRVYLRTLAQEAYKEAENFDVMKKLAPEDVHKLMQMVLNQVQSKLQAGVNVVLEDFGVFRIKHPNAKTRRSFDIATQQIVDHKLYSKVNFVSHFPVGEDNGRSDKSSG